MNFVNKKLIFVWECQFKKGMGNKDNNNNQNNNQPFYKNQLSLKMMVLLTGGVRSHVQRLRTLVHFAHI